MGALVMVARIGKEEIFIESGSEMMTDMLVVSLQKERTNKNLEETLILNPDRRRIHVSEKAVTLTRKMMRRRENHSQSIRFITFGNVLRVGVDMKYLVAQVL
ncbi:unnamed protein product [Linum trigynum]|uniref:Uncharacterized protein n=1 Tax=Linum trigynum TaxID=586398 RepID=A0AAV2CKV0_9ROSI